MRWVLSIRLVSTALVIGLTTAIASCGGAPAAPTATTAPTATAPAALMATIAPTATPIPSPTDTPSPTATPRPAIITSTPRPIATRPPLGVPTAAPTATGERRNVLAVDFESGPGPFPTSTGSDGSSLAVQGGAYVVTVPEGYWLSAVPTSPPIELQDGVISVEVGLSGNGFAGIVGRHAASADGSETFLVCGIDSDGSAGCYEYLDAAFTEVLSAAPGAFTPRDVNRLSLTIVDTWFAFDVNQRMVGEGSMISDVTGNWGVYTESMGGTSAATYQWLAVTSPVVASRAFDDGTPDPFFAGENQQEGWTIGVQDGRYVATLHGMQGQFWQYSSPQPSTVIADGLIETSASVVGYGAAGLIARGELSSNGLDAGYVCQVEDDGRAGCYRKVSDGWATLFEVPVGTFDASGLTAMTMRVTGTQIAFVVNGQTVGTTDDDSVRNGEWGMFYSTFSEDPTEVTVASFDTILILDMGQ